MPRDIAKAYEPHTVEERWSRYWVEERLFTPERAAELRPPERGTYALAIPPPNVTGSLHMGHMLEHTQIDILMRWRRMLGHRVLWLPGMDHAGISTQVVVERQLAAEGTSREAIGREAFEERVWQWKEQSGGAILHQMRRIGDSVDWSREAFTMDAPRYRAVLEAFLRLYGEGLIYRGRYMINWCPRCRTALSDLETPREERSGHLWHIRYPLEGGGHIVVATTRPETMLGDTAVAVHPADERYRRLVGRRAILPLLNRAIPVIADEAVDREFGTGAVKVTPAHDPHDLEIARRHNLDEINVMDDEARINARGGPYAGLDRFAARKEIVAALEAQGLLEKIEPHTHAVGLCQRCSTVVEPRLSVQWFCKMKPLAEPAIQAVRDGLVQILPENQRAIYLNWMENIRDWCISRQLWWGHRIPVWHCLHCQAQTPAQDSQVQVVNGRAVPASPPRACAQCGNPAIHQDPDVLDTWFSSALWPFSTLGWPDDTPDLRAFYPTTLMINGFDILFFWDARMMMMGLHLLRDIRPRAEERIPFRTLYIHALVRDAEGQKMSKMRGNVTDPLALIERYGTDAARFALTVQAAPGTDILLKEERFSAARAFANKIWNAARFLYFNLEKIEARGVTLEELAAPEVRAAAPHLARGALALVDRWMFSRLTRTVGEAGAALEEFRFHEAADRVYHFFWGDFCDWYIEWLKPVLASDNREEAIAAWRNLFAVFEAALRLLHPFMPFLTEELWQQLPQRAAAKSIALEPFPEPRAQGTDAQAEEHVALLQEIITAARNIRAELKLDPKKKAAADIALADSSLRALVEAHLDPVLRLASLSELHFSAGRLDPAGGPIRSTAAFDLRIPFGEAVDTAAETARLRKELDRLDRDIAAKTARLADDGFRSRAPGHVVRALEAALAERRLEHEKLAARLAQMERAAH